jgi:hypothetical protein
MNKTLCVGLGLAALVAGCDGGTARKPAAATPAVAERPRPQAGTLHRLESFAFSAFVVPVLDDGDSTRFVDPRIAPLCGEDTEVEVNGQPLQAGTPVPAGAFTLDWTMQMFCPFGPDQVALDGRTRVLVFRDDEHGMEAIVMPQALTVSDERGAVRLTTQAPAWVSTQWRQSEGARPREQ